MIYRKTSYKNRKNYFTPKGAKSIRKVTKISIWIKSIFND